MQKSGNQMVQTLVSDQTMLLVEAFRQIWQKHFIF